MVKKRNAAVAASTPKKRSKSSLTKSAAPSPASVAQFSTSGALLNGISDMLEEARAIDERDVPGTRSWKVEEGLAHLAKLEPSFASAIVELGIPFHLKRPSAFLPQSANGSSAVPNWFPSLFRTIVSQQLASAAADTIHAKCIEAYTSQKDGEITASLVINASYAERKMKGEGDGLKQFVNGARPGLSRSKREYLQSLAEHFSDPERLKDVDLSMLSEAELSERLTAVKGLGDWSVEMFKIFKLRRPDVFSVGDLAVRKGTALILGHKADKFESSKGKKELVELAERFEPYRSLVCMYAYARWDREKPKKK